MTHNVQWLRWLFGKGLNNTSNHVYGFLIMFVLLLICLLLYLIVLLSVHGCKTAINKAVKSKHIHAAGRKKTQQRKWWQYLKARAERETYMNGIKEEIIQERTKGKCSFFIGFYEKLKSFYRAQMKKHKPTIKKLSTSGTFENYILMAVLGLIIGMFITFVTFKLEIYHGDASIVSSFLVRLPILVGMTVLLSFTKSARCLLLLAPIQLCSTSGKVYIGGKVMVMIMEGPLHNLRHNLDVIQESSSCQQKGVAAGAAEIADILFGPFSSFKQAAAEIVNGLKKMVEKLENMLAGFKRTVMAVADAIQDATKWINSKINGCKTTVGTTYQHCMLAFSEMHDECKVNVPGIFEHLCSVSTLLSNLCSSVKPAEYLCDLVYYTVDPLVTTINQRISRLWDRAYTLMYFSVNVVHKFDLESNSKTIADELKAKMSSLISKNIGEYLLSVYALFQIILDMYFLWSIYRYRYLYLRRENYDNYFINNELVQLNNRQWQSGKSTLFPLRRTERKKYIRASSVSLARREIITYSHLFLMILKTIGFVKIMVFDYVMYKVADKCRLFMLAVLQSAGTRTEMEVIGSGFISELSRRVVSALNYVEHDFYYKHLMPCIPDPKPPDSWVNKKICFLLVLFWLSWITRPFVLRLRHVVMDYYHPDMKLRRARWLYKRIEFKRMTFINLIRIKLMSTFVSGKKGVSVIDMLRVRFPWITRVIGKGTITEECIICHCLNTPLYRCNQTGCPGIYCDECSLAIQSSCSLCRGVIKQRNYSNLVEERFQEPEVDEDPQYFKVDLSKSENIDFDYQKGFVYLIESEEGNQEPNV